MKGIKSTPARGVFRKKLLQPLLVLAGIVMAAAGIWRGEIFFVFQKAIVVCLECMGIG